MDFNKTLLLDDRLNVSSSIDYAVEKGFTSIAQNVVSASSPSTNQMSYNVVVPSMGTIIDRSVIFRNTFILKVEGTAPAGQFLVNLGTTDALGSYPINSQIANYNVSINSQSYTFNVAQNFQALINLQPDNRHLVRYAGCPNMPDQLFSYADGVGANCNVLGAYENSSDGDIVPRGSFVVDYIGQDPACTTPLNMIPSTGAAQTIYIKYTTNEPVLCPPFLYSTVANKAGMYGISNFVINCTFNSSGATQRLFRTASAFAKSVTLFKIERSEMIFNYCAPPASVPLPPRSVLPYYDMTAQTTVLGSSVAPGASSSIVAKSLQLGIIPDSILLFIRKINTKQTAQDSDAFMAINNINLTWDSVPGLLSGLTQHQLYQLSVENGSSQNVHQFIGKCLMSDAATGSGRIVPTVGSFVVLNVAKDIPLANLALAPGSQSQCNLSFTVQFTNQSAVTQSDLELVIIPVNSGYMAFDGNGGLQLRTGILNSNDVLDTNAQSGVFKGDARRLVGSGWWDNLKGMIGKYAPMALPYAKTWLSKQDNPYAKLGSQVLDVAGYAKPKGRLSSRLI